MNFRVNLKMKKPTLCCCFTWIVFIELNFTVAFLLIRKTLDDRFAGKVGGGGWGGILRNGGIPVMGGSMILKWGVGGWYSFMDYAPTLSVLLKASPRKLRP